MSSAPHPQQPQLVNKLQPPPVNGTSTNSISSSTAQYDSSPAEGVSPNVSQQHSEPSVSGSTSKKGKVKKATDPLETSKLLAAKISQLESDRAGERDIEAEIGEFSSSLSRLYFKHLHISLLLERSITCEEHLEQDAVVSALH